MALPVDLLLSRTELPQDGARLDPAHPLAGRFVTAYLPGVSSDNLGFGGPGGIVGNAHSRSAIPAGPTLRLSGSGANATTNRSYGPTPSYPLTMVIVCRQGSNTNGTIAAIAASSAIGGSYWYVGGGSSTQISLSARNNFGSTIAMLATVPADANGNQAIGQDLVIVAQSLSASDHRLCVNGSAIVTATTNIGSMVAWDRLFLGQTSGTTSLDVAAVLFAHGGTALTDAQMRQIASHPREVWELFEPQRLTIPGTSAASGYTLTADAASFTLTGVATGLIAARSLTADQQSYSLTGVAANLLRGFSLTADQASFTLTGVDVGLTTARLLTADRQTYTLTGVDAGLTYTPAGAYTLTADVGTFTLTGNAAGLNYYKLTADTVAFAFTGNDATLTYTPLGAYTLTADSGSFALTGGAAALSGSSSLRGRVVRRRKTKTPLPIAEDVIETPAVTQSLISSDAMKLLVEKAGDNARQAVKVARVKAEKKRIEIQKAEEAAIEKALFEWF